MRYREQFRIIKYILLPVIGIIFLILYLRASAVDVVYSDYIRLINEYLPDVTDISKLLVPDILTRIPAAFLARLVNVSSFGYSVTFDRALCIIGIAIMAYVSAAYMYRKEISFKWQLAFYIILFSLNKWEILLNGTAWPHMVSFGLFFVSYQLLDLVWIKEADSRQELAVCVMPVAMLLFAGEYIASYACTVMLVCIMGLLLGGANSMAGRREQSLFISILISAAAALLLYMLSRHFAVWEHSGATDMSLLQVISTDPKFIPKFFIKTFSGAAIGQEVVNSLIPGGAAVPNKIVLLIGLIVMFGYLLALVMYFADDMLEKTIFPLVLIISGLANHAVVTIGRWIFLREDYALSSRYGGQFMIGILGMLLVFAMYGRDRRSVRRADEKKRMLCRIAAAAAAVLITAGNCYTDYRELRIAKYRKANYEKMAEAIVDYRARSEDELLAILEWHKDPDELYSAIEILRDNKLNVFSKPHIADESEQKSGRK